MGKNLYNKVFDQHTVRQLPSGQYQLFIGLHMIHEVTSPQAFAMLKENNWKVAYPQRTFATVDHIIPTESLSRPYADPLAEQMIVALEENTAEAGINFFKCGSGNQGIVHIVAPEQGLTQPGMTICCGDSHTSTHGAFGSLAFGIGTSQVRDVLATQTLCANKLKVKKVVVNGKLKPGVYAKDVALFLIQRLGVKGGVGYAFEYAGNVFDEMSMDERMTVCNMAIEGGARIGYINPDQTTFDFIQGKPYAPKGEAWETAISYWNSISSDADAEYDDIVEFKAEDIEPTLTWGINPEQSISVNDNIPTGDTENLAEALEYMQFEGGEKLAGKKIDVCFIGSCTNARLSDFAEVVSLLEQNPELKVAAGVKALIVPGSEQVKADMLERNWDKLFTERGFEFREPGCSMCLAMNPDKLQGDQMCASSSNRNFKGRQGSSRGRTLLMSPVMVAACAIRGCVADAREVFSASAN